MQYEYGYRMLWHMPSSTSMYNSPMCAPCTSYYAVAPDVLLKYRLAEVVSDSWLECSRCLELSDPDVHDIQSWYTTCVERSYAVLDIFHEQCEKESKKFVTEVEKRISCLPRFQELQSVLNSTDHLCVKDLCKLMQQSMFYKVYKANWSHTEYASLHSFLHNSSQLRADRHAKAQLTLWPRTCSVGFSACSCMWQPVVTKHLTIMQLQVQVYLGYRKSMVSHTHMYMVQWLHLCTQSRLILYIIIIWSVLVTKMQYVP